MSRMPVDLLGFERTFIPQNGTNFLEQLQQKLPAAGNSPILVI
jgi:hypothetical protein